MKGIKLSLLIILACLALPSMANNFAIASSNKFATNAGISILEQGGNAFDAAVSVAAVLAVVEPHNSGLGGGGFFLLHQKSSNKDIVIDAREVAPQKSNLKYYLDYNKKLIPSMTELSASSAAIPGEPYALVHLAEKYGTLPLNTLLAPAIELAENGFAIDANLLKVIEYNQYRIRSNTLLKKTMFIGRREIPKIGDIIVQKDLANTLRLLAKDGIKGFYDSDFSQNLVNQVVSYGGFWSKEDLKNYKIIEREPIVGTYKNYKITTVPPPSAGGIILLQSLNILENFPLQTEEEKAHLSAEALRLSFCDRAKYLADPDFVKVPYKQLIAKDYAKTLAAKINPEQTTSSENLNCNVDKLNASNTTHFSIIDANGNKVAATLSLNYWFGSAMMPYKTGIILNNHIDDFYFPEKIMGNYGERVQSNHINALEGGKRPVSSMTPMFIEKSNDGCYGAILGTPGGRRIPSILLNTILDLDSLGLEQSIAKDRLHQQYLPDVVELESGSKIETKTMLEAKGHEVKFVDRKYGNVQAVEYNCQGLVKAINDPRFDY